MFLVDLVVFASVCLAHSGQDFVAGAIVLFLFLVKMWRGVGKDFAIISRYFVIRASQKCGNFCSQFWVRRKQDDAPLLGGVVKILTFDLDQIGLGQDACFRFHIPKVLLQTHL